MPYINRPRGYKATILDCVGGIIFIMRSPLAFAFVLSTLVSLSIQSGVISPLPNCFVCPFEDLDGRPLEQHSNSASELFCRYESIPNDFFCKYFLVNPDSALRDTFFLINLRLRTRVC